MHDDPRTLVSTGWLETHLADPGLRVLDASWYLPGAGRDPAAEFEAARIPGARRIDIDSVSDPENPLPHMVPPPALFAERLAGLGIDAASQVVVYDATGLFSSPRIWWLFRLMGHAQVAVLDGGLPKWRAEGRALESGPALPALPATGAAGLQPVPALLSDGDGVARALNTRAAQILDARPGPRFRGEVPEPRPGLRQGHIPGSLNLPHSEMLNPDGTLKAPEGLRAALAGAGVDLDRPVITTCGSGVSAAVLSLALARLGHGHNALYDGSWADWGRIGDRPVATGA